MPASADSVFERLLALNPETELWWDSSPVVFPAWRDRMIARFPGRPGLPAQLDRLFDKNNPARSLVAGVTTNPILALQALEARPDLFRPLITRLATEWPHADSEVIYWKTYLEVVRVGAQALLPQWEQTGGARGYLSGQVDPRHAGNEELMFRQALEIAAQGPNVMVKCPGTAAGIRVIRRLTALGVATNCTLSFILPQFVAVSDAVQTGLAEARAAGVRLYRWRSVITQMLARFEERPAFEESARAAGVALGPDDRRWAGISLFHRAQAALRRRGYPGKLLLCSMRRGPALGGRDRYWHVEKTAGHATVYTCPPDCLADLLDLQDHLELRAQPHDPTPADVRERLERVPYFAEAVAEDMNPEHFATLPASLFTLRQFSEATEKTVAYVRRITPATAAA